MSGERRFNFGYSQRRQVNEVWVAAFFAIECGADELPKQRMGSIRSRKEFRMGLGANPKWMAGKFNKFRQSTIRRRSAEHQTPFFETFAIPGIDFVTMAVTFIDDRFTVGFGDLRTGLQFCWIQSEAHGAAHVDDVALLVHEVDDPMRRTSVELA